MVLEEAKPSGVVCEDLDLFPVEGVPESDHKVATAGALVVVVCVLGVAFPP